MAEMYVYYPKQSDTVSFSLPHGYKYSLPIPFPRSEMFWKVVREMKVGEWKEYGSGIDILILKKTEEQIISLSSATLKCFLYLSQLQNLVMYAETPPPYPAEVDVRRVDDIVSRFFSKESLIEATKELLSNAPEVDPLDDSFPSRGLSSYRME